MVDSIFYKKYLVVQIPKAALQELLYRKLWDVYVEWHQHTGTVNSYSYKLSELIPKYHSELTWEEVEAIIHKGKNWEYGVYGSVTVRLVMSWMKEGKKTILKSDKSSRISNSSLDWIRFIKWCNHYDIPESVYATMTVQDFKKGKYEGKFKKRKLC